LKKIILLILIIILSKQVYPQFSIGIIFNGIGYHPNSDTKDFKWKISKDGKLAGFASISIIGTYRFNNYIGIKIAQNIAIYDCTGRLSGITHIGINFHDDILGMKSTINQISASFGPFWYYRKNWNKNPNYKYNPNFIKQSKNKTWEHLFIWHGGHIEYNYSINSHNSLTLSLLPAYPHIYAIGIGTHYTK